MRIRIDNMRVGTKFTDLDGDQWRLIRQHRANKGAYLAQRVDGHKDYFAGCAEFEEVTK